MFQIYEYNQYHEHLMHLFYTICHFLQLNNIYQKFQQIIYLKILIIITQNKKY